ncbi:MAG: phosphate acyltransferase PlsX [Candidatus Eisenbacteria bacterium]|uniref:Phosphate acyltransferase n=1 Tax=Eiseniibacteriota bacterium TaxID=2212470 RepID=A0A948RT92_UNCEI|nr:phosphate acyltransferase PlsX [Candidatus Eisenbacteria bacterium]MBU1948924.1 phosphate acyltransferase PlsX [Candidatus Eisenbacteria bacterium]MBU2690590.1 phosphate acyltransferase PlsX [Candidatus Eisenbacteria bacterium]
MRIGVDAMGGDHAPERIVRGAVEAARAHENEWQVVLIGDREAIRPHLEALKADEKKIAIVHTTQKVEMSDRAVEAIRRSPDASIVVASRLLRKGELDAVVSAGNTGGVVASSLLNLGRIPGVLRPAIAVIVPTPKGHCVLLDAGANSDCRPVHLLQFAIMGRVYAKYLFGVDKPRIGLLNIGEESSKGNDLTQQTFVLLDENKEKLNFIGNVEGRDVLRGTAEVVVCDGFVGNVILKFAESVLGLVIETTRRELQNNLKLQIGALLMKPVISRIRSRFNYEEYGGAPLLGVNGITVIAHGSSSVTAIRNAVETAARSARLRIQDLIREEIQGEPNAREAAG